MHACACVSVFSPDLPDLSGAKLFYPPTPILREDNWPLLEVKKGFFERLDEEPIEEKTNEEGERHYVDSDGEGEEVEETEKDLLGWGDENNDLGVDGEAKAGKKKTAA